MTCRCGMIASSSRDPGGKVVLRGGSSYNRRGRRSRSWRGGISNERMITRGSHPPVCGLRSAVYGRSAICNLQSAICGLGAGRTAALSLLEIRMSLAVAGCWVHAQGASCVSKWLLCRILALRGNSWVTFGCPCVGNLQVPATLGLG